jgi:glycerol-3-phosphate O-acyltransferase
LDIENNNALLPLPYVEQDIYKWGLYQLSLHKDEFLNEVVESVIEKIKFQYPTTKALYEELASTLYQERIRLSTSRWKSDPKDDKDFWNNIKGALIKIKKNKNWEQEEEKNIHSILKKILYRYAYEIVGNFNPSVFSSVQKILPYIFSFFLKSKVSNSQKLFWSLKKPFYDKFKITGDFNLIRELSKIGSVIIVPTHSSNVDSPIIGWALNAIGLEAVTYGAGVNLFGTQPFSYLMGNLGAYKIDRRKKNKIYLEILKNYSQTAIQRNTPSLFYPGGTRSRSGSIENKLKLGLLSTAVEAQQNNFLNNGKKIFVIPVVLNYHFNIEATSLINQHLKELGKEKYVSENFEYSTTYKLLRTFKQLMSSNSELIVSFGNPMDVIGHRVNNLGESVSPYGTSFDIKGYFEIENKIAFDEQRNFEYTKILGDKIVASYYQNNTVLTSNIVSFVMFELTQQKHKNLNLFELLLLPKEDRTIDYGIFLDSAKKVKARIMELYSEGKINISDKIESSLEEILAHALDNISLLNSKKIIYLDSDGNLNSEDLRLLLFYHNRLKGYGLEKYI